MMERILRKFVESIRATLTDTCNTIDFWERGSHYIHKLAVDIRGLKSRKTADEDEIRPKMLKTLNGEGIGRLRRVCQVM